jgi:hypothetical protein
MLKKKLSQRKRVNKQRFNSCNKNKFALKTSVIGAIIGYLGIKLVDIVFNAIFEQPIKDLLPEVVNWIKSILI